MTKSDLVRQQAEKNKRLGLILASIAFVFFAGLVVKKLFIG